MVSGLRLRLCVVVVVHHRGLGDVFHGVGGLQVLLVELGVVGQHLIGETTPALVVEVFVFDQKLLLVLLVVDHGGAWIRGGGVILQVIGHPLTGLFFDLLSTSFRYYPWNKQNHFLL